MCTLCCKAYFLSCAFIGIAKQFVVPGWRVGWLTVFDRTPNKLGSDLLVALKSLSQLILGATGLVQACIPRLLCRDVTHSDYQRLQEFSAKYLDILRTNAEICVNEVARCNDSLGSSSMLTISRPTGAMYTMIGIAVDRLDESINDDAEFARLLLQEENLSLLPGQCFGMRNFVRLVICPSPDILREAFDRLTSCLRRHMKVCA